jgi:lipoprotein-anchoring transpeptidase ErfK/SrfK
MSSRTAVAAICFLLTGFAVPTSEVVAQPFPSLPAPAQMPSPFHTLPPAAVEFEDLPPYDPPPGYRGAPPEPGYSQPPQTYEQSTLPPPGQGQYSRGRPGYPENEALPPPGSYREPYPQGGYQPPPAPPQYGSAPPPQHYESAPPPQQQDALRPPGLLPGQPGVGGHDITSSLPPEDRPETGPRKELPPQFRRTQVNFNTREPAGTIVIDTANTYLYLILGGGKAMRYGIGVGREGFTWAGAERVSRMAEWPDWHPPAEMIERQPYLPRFMAGGEGNPLGARALYLGKTLYRIHGTNQPSTIGSFVSSGCIRLTNEDIIDLYYRVKVGTRVVVLPGKPPATASAAPPGPPVSSAGRPMMPAADAEPYGEPIPLNPPPVIRAR